MLNYDSTLISDCGICTLKIREYSVTVFSVLSILYIFTTSMFLNRGIASCDTNITFGSFIWLQVLTLPPHI